MATTAPLTSSCATRSPPTRTTRRGSLNISQGANAGTKTDGFSDDQAEFDGPNDRVVFRLGAGANATNGGQPRAGRHIRGEVPGADRGQRSGRTPRSGIRPHAAYDAATTGESLVSESNEVVTVTPGAPAINVDKTGLATANHGGTMNFSYAVTNPSQVPVGNVILTDDQCSPVSAPVKTGGDQDALLEPGETWTYTCSRAVPDHANETDPFVNVATVSGQAGALSVSDTDQHSTDILHPAIEVVKSGTNESAPRRDAGVLIRREKCGGHPARHRHAQRRPMLARERAHQDGRRPGQPPRERRDVDVHLLDAGAPAYRR